MTKLLSILLFLNFLTAVSFLLLMFHAQSLSPIAVMARYTELDRAQVIDNKQLAITFPQLAGNPRHDVPIYIAGNVLRHAQRNAELGLVVAVANWICVIALLFIVSRNRSSTKSLKQSTP